MIEDIPEIREQLTGHWRKAGVELVKHGFRPAAIFETMFAVGLAGYIEVHGEEAAAERLLSVARKLSEKLRTEAEATEEAKRSTKN